LDELFNSPFPLSDTNGEKYELSLAAVFPLLLINLCILMPTFLFPLSVGALTFLQSAGKLTEELAELEDDEILLFEKLISLDSLLSLKGLSL
jgi:hypothetical protein